MALDNADAKADGAALAERIAEKAEKKVQEKEQSSAPADSFPTDWMNPKNVMKYDIDSDPMKDRIEKDASAADEQRKFNLKTVGLVQKKRKTAYELLYVEDQ